MPEDSTDAPVASHTAQNTYQHIALCVNCMQEVPLRFLPTPGRPMLCHACRIEINGVCPCEGGLPLSGDCPAPRMSA